jgi:GT2 family glycosyltransferase
MDLLIPCLRSLAALPATPSHEVVVIANGTPESALATLPGQESLVLVISSLNLGFGGGCNWGARFARGRYLVFLNDDTVVEPDWLRALIEVVEDDPRIGAVGSRLLDPDGTLQEAGSILWSDASTHQVGRGLPPGTRAYDSVRDVDYCSACGLLVRREAWEAVGGFDEAYFPAYHEDVDLCLSLRARGYRTVYAPGARVVHHRGGSLRGERRVAIGVHSGLHFIAKWGEALNDFDPPPPGRAPAAAVAAAIARTSRRPLPPLRPPEAGGEPARPPTEVDLLQAQVRALQAAEAIAADELGSLRREHARVERLRHLVWRLPLGRRATAWASRRLGGTR